MYVELLVIARPQCEFVDDYSSESLEIQSHAAQRFGFAVIQDMSVETIRGAGVDGVEKDVERDHDVQERVEATAVVFFKHTKEEFLPEIPPLGFAAPFRFHKKIVV